MIVWTLTLWLCLNNECGLANPFEFDAPSVYPSLAACVVERRRIKHEHPDMRGYCRKTRVAAPTEEPHAS